MFDSLWKNNSIEPEVQALHFAKKETKEKEAMEEIFKELQEGIKRKKVKLSDLEVKVLDLEMWRKTNFPA